MADTYRTVRLLKNHRYSTYQLFAVMENSKTKPQDGLRLGALTALQWLRGRLGGDLQEESLQAPEPSDYLTASDNCLRSLHLNKGFVIDIVFDPGSHWTLQITEPDLGSDPGNPTQTRAAVPGRLFETNVEFRIVGQTLECGFQTKVSDPGNQETPAEVYRLALIRLLLHNPNFGLKQIVPLKEKAKRIASLEQVRKLFRIWKDPENQLPCVIFSQTKTEAELPKLPDFNAAPGLMLKQTPLLPTGLPSASAIKRTEVQDPPYDYSYFSKSTVTFCRCYLLEESMRQKFKVQLGKEFLPGDIVTLDPKVFGGAYEIYPYFPSKQRQNETMMALKEKYKSYPRGRTVSFGSIEFLSAAHQSLFERVFAELEQALKESSESEARQQEILQPIKEQLANLEVESQKKDEDILTLQKKREQCKW